MAGNGHTPEQPGHQSINWRRFAVLASGVITGMAAIRLVADAVGVPRGSTTSAAVSSVSNFMMYLTLGLAAPYVVAGVRKRSVWRRLAVLLPIATIAAVMNFWILTDAQ